MVNQQCNDEGLRELALFAGAGGGILGGKLLGFRTICAVEYNAYARSVLLARQNDGALSPFPIWDDVRTFDGTKWRGLVDVVSGGFPCQDISIAGKQAGLDGKRSGLWFEMSRIIGEVRPKYAFVENSPMLINNGLDRVLEDFTEMGYDCKWGIVSAASVGACHERKRVWIRATYSSGVRRYERFSNREGRHFLHDINRNASENKSERQERFSGIGTASENVADTNFSHGERDQLSERSIEEYHYGCSNGWWDSEPNIPRVADGVAFRVDRLKAIGNGQVPLAAATAWKLLE